LVLQVNRSRSLFKKNIKMDSLIIERNGKYETWYSDEYIKQQMESAYRSGLHKGMKLQFHAVEPQSSEYAERLVGDIKRILDDEYQKSYNNSEIWRQG
jgi:hypothetical protein